MALSASRVAAFEFLIQFRSAGRNQIRNAVRQLRSVSVASNQAALSARQNIALTDAYSASLMRQGLSAVEAARRTSIYITSLVAARRAAQRAAIQANQDRVTRAFNNPLAGLFGVFNSRGRAGAAVGIANVQRSFSRLAGPIRIASGALNVLVGTFRTYIGVLTKLVKFNAIFIGALGLVGAALARLGDNFTLLSNRVRVASDGTRSVSSTMNELLEISNRARAPVNDIAELYGRIAINAKQFGISQEEILRVVEITGKTFRIGGSNAREAQQAALQFAQALGSNRLSGDELRAVREQATELSQTLARGLNASGDFGAVGVGRLKELGEEGVLTTKVVIDALLSQERIVNARFGRVEATFADGITNIRSSLGFLIGSIGSALGLGPQFFAFFDRLSESFNRLGAVSGDFAVAISRLPRFFQILGRNGLSRVIRLFSQLGDFLVSIPDKILELGRNINEFINEFERSGDIELAAQSAFGLSSEDLRNSPLLRGIDNVANLFSRQLPIVIGQVVSFGSALEKITNFINGIADTGSRIGSIGTFANNPILAAGVASKYYASRHTDGRN